MARGELYRGMFSDFVSCDVDEERAMWRIACEDVIGVKTADTYIMNIFQHSPANEYEFDFNHVYYLIDVGIPDTVPESVRINDNSSVKDNSSRESDPPDL
jgi:hypothetical protein